MRWAGFRIRPVRRDEKFTEKKADEMLFLELARRRDHQDRVAGLQDRN